MNSDDDNVAEKNSANHEDAHQVEITNDQNVIEIDEQELLAIARHSLAHLNIARSLINIMIVDNKTIHKINNQFLQHDFPTDVITFPMNEPSESEEQLVEGEIVISAETASELAKIVGWETGNEISLYLIHGLLHLCGYDDLNEQDQKIMRHQERKLLTATNITPKKNDPRWQDLL